MRDCSLVGIIETDEIIVIKDFRVLRRKRRYSHGDQIFIYSPENSIPPLLVNAFQQTLQALFRLLLFFVTTSCESEKIRFFAVEITQEKRTFVGVCIELERVCEDAGSFPMKEKPTD